MVDTAGNESDWRDRHDRHRQDRPDAVRQLRRRRLARGAGRLLGHRQRRRLRPADADRLATAARPTPSPAAATPWTPTAPRPCIFRAVDGAGNETLASADVKIDRTAPTAAVTCTPGAGTTYVCKGDGADDLSGVTGMSWSVDGSAATPMSSGGTFTVTKGTVVVTAIDAAGNAGASAPVTLADRTPPVEAADPRRDRHGHAAHDQRGRPAQARRRRVRAPARPAGDLGDADPDDRRPAPARARQGHVPVRAQGHHRQEVQDVHQDRQTKKGYSTRISVKAAAAAHAKVTLTIKRKSGKRWVTYASGGAELE